jgi:hypothetical protein
LKGWCCVGARQSCEAVSRLQRTPYGIDRAGTYRLLSGKLDPNSPIFILILGQSRIRAMDMINPRHVSMADPAMTFGSQGHRPKIAPLGEQFEVDD